MVSPVPVPPFAGSGHDPDKGCKQKTLPGFPVHTLPSVPAERMSSGKSRSHREKGLQGWKNWYALRWKGSAYSDFHPVFLPGSKARQDKMPSRIPESAPVTFEVLPQKAPESHLPPGLCSGYIYY